MKTDPRWDDCELFAAVARAGSIARAADAAGVSVATLSRRMRAFESGLGRRLFVHGAAGYSLTAAGRELWERVGRMEEAAAGIARWSADPDGPVPVRISAGTWTALLLSERLHDIWQPGAPWLPEFLHSERALDIARREIDIGLRNARPDQPWLAGQKVGVTAFAVYGRDAQVTGWIGPARDAAVNRSARWVEREHGARIVTRTNLPPMALHMARAGIGRTVLPVEVGDFAPGLTRLSDPIPDLEMDRWLVSHHEGRHEPPVRAALDALAAFFRGTAP